MSHRFRGFYAQARDRKRHPQYRGFNAQRRDRQPSAWQSRLQREQDEETRLERAADRCNICSYTQSYPAEKVAIYHRHFNSVNVREILDVENSETAYHYCPSCKSRHRSYPYERIKVAVSDSTLHEFFSLNTHTSAVYEGDLLHVDYVTIDGGTIPDLLHAFRLEYEAKKKTKPLDVVLIAGYTDLYRGFGRDYIWRGLNKFAETVLGLRNSDPNIKNTFTIASLMFPPRICWFADNGPAPAGYQNQMEKVEWLNRRITDMNKANNMPIFPGFHSYGTRKAVTSYTDEEGVVKQRHTRSHRWEHWTERRRQSKATLRADRRIKMGKALNNFFIARTT